MKAMYTRLVEGRRPEGQVQLVEGRRPEGLSVDHEKGFCVYTYSQGFFQ